jgi:benzoyl-CoA reductase/2-hydroxyglutaryl-CoA dehydratase subunit BcrC/BadD/HgdB
MSIESIISELAGVAENPGKQLADFKKQGKKVIGVLPYYAPEELVYAAGMVPMGMWGSNDKTISRAKEYCATFYCTIAQLDLEMLLDGTMDQLDGVITPTICDTLRPMSQNIRVAMEKLKKMPTIFLAHPQNRKPTYGLKFCADQYTNVRKALEKISGAPIKDEAIQNAIKVYNASRAARRKFVKLANDHCDVITPTKRSAVLKASFFMLKDAYTAKLEKLNEELEKLPDCEWKGVKVVTSGIICDNPSLLKIFEENDVAIAADDVAQESRSFRVDAPENFDDPMMALATQFANQDYDVLLFDEHSSENRRAEHVASLVRENEAQGVIVFMQQFCDPEEMEYPYLKKALDAAGILHIKLGIDQQMRDFGQASTAIQAFADVLKTQKD